MASQDFIAKNNPAPNASSEPNKQSSKSAPEIPPALAVSKLPPSHAKCQITYKQEKNWWDQWKPFVEMGGIVLLAIYTGYTIKQVHVSQRSSRPFVGIEQFSIQHGWTDPNDKTLHTSTGPTTQTTGMQFAANVRNFGPLPALSFDGIWQVYLDGVKQEAKRIEQRPSTLNPTQQLNFTAGVGGASYRDIKNGTKILTVHIIIAYDGPEDHYHECNAYRYSSEMNSFVETGPC